MSMSHVSTWPKIGPRRTNRALRIGIVCGTVPVSYLSGHNLSPGCNLTSTWLAPRKLHCLARNLLQHFVFLWAEILCLLVDTIIRLHVIFLIGGAGHLTIPKTSLKKKRHCEREDVPLLSRVRMTVIPTGMHHWLHIFR